MKVRELIEKLNQYNPDALIVTEMVTDEDCFIARLDNLTYLGRQGADFNKATCDQVSLNFTDKRKPVISPEDNYLLDEYNEEGEMLNG